MANKLTNNYNNQFNNPPIEGYNIEESYNQQDPIGEKVNRFNRLKDLEIRPEKIDINMDEIEKLPGLVDPHTRNIRKELHEQQSWYSSLANSMNQAIVGEIVGLTLEGTGYLLDLPQYANIVKGTEQEFGNWLSDLGKELRTWTQEATPIYTDPSKQGGFNPEDWSWWMSNLPSVASTLALMLPSGVAVKGLSILAKAINLSNKVGKITRWTAKGLTQAIMSRHMESLMESSELMPQIIEEFTGQQLNEEQAVKISRNYGIDLAPTGQDDKGNNLYEITEDIAQQIGAKAASDSYKANWAMLVQDIPQYMLLNTPFGKSTQKLTSSLAKKLGVNPIPVIANKATAIGKDMLSEGGEEAYQYIVSERSRELALANAGLVDERSLNEALGDYFQSSDLWTSAFFGAMGAGVMQTVGKSFTNRMNRVRGMEGETERRMKNIDSWGTQFKMYRDLKDVAGAEGSQTLDEVSEDQLTADLGVNAAANGNTGHLINAIKEIPNMTQEEQEQLGFTEEDVEYAKQKNPSLVQDIQEIGESYERNVNKYDPVFAQQITKEDFLGKKYLRKAREKESNTTSLLNNIANLDRLSASGRSIVENELVKLPAYKQARDFLKARLDKTTNNDHKDILNRQIKRIDSLIESTEEDINTSKESRTNREAKLDNQVQIGDEISDAQRLFIESVFDNITGNEALDYASLMRTPEWQKKALDQLKKNDSRHLDDLIDSAESPEEVRQIQNQAVGTEVESLTKSKITKKANEQVKSTPEAQQEATTKTMITNDDRRQLADLGYSREDISAMRPEQAAQIIQNQTTKKQPTEGGEVVFESKYEGKQQPTITDIRKSAKQSENWAQDRYKNRNELFVKETDDLEKRLNNVDDPSENEKNLINQFKTSKKNPQALDQWLNRVDTQPNTDKITNTVRQYFNERNQAASASNRESDPTRSSNYNRPVVDPGQQDTDSFNKIIPVNKLESKFREAGFNPESNDTDIVESILGVIPNQGGLTNVQIPRLGIMPKGRYTKKNIKTALSNVVGEDKANNIIEFLDNELSADNENFKEDWSNFYRQDEVTTEKPIGTNINSILQTQPSKPIGISEENMNKPPRRNQVGITKPGLKGSEKGNYIAVNLLDIVDKKGIARGEYSPGDTVYFEIDKQDKYSKKPYKERGIQIVVYKDGNTSNKSQSNRKVVGLVPTSGTGANVRYASDINNIRKRISDDIDTKLDTHPRYITSKFTSTILGAFVERSIVQERNNPSKVLRKQDKEDPDFKPYGGFVIGYTERNPSTGQMVWKPDNSNQDYINLPRTEYEGQIIIGTRNPIIGDTLLLKAFVRKLGDFEKQNKTNQKRGQQLRDKVIQQLKRITEKSSYEELVDVNNNINKYLVTKIRPIAGDPTALNLDGLRVPISDIQNDNLEDVNKWLSDRIFNIDKNKINLRRTTVDLGWGAQSGPYNKLVNDLLVLNIKPNEYYNSDTASAIISDKIYEQEVIEQQEQQTGQAVSNLIGQPTIKENLSDSITKPIEQSTDNSIEIPPSTKSQVKPSKPIKIQRRGSKLGAAGSQKLKDRINSNRNKPKSRYADEVINYKPWNRAEEIAWFKKNFPQVPISVLDNLKEIVANGVEAWGAFHNASVYIAKNASTGTVYHEAFHTVFNLFLDDTQRKQLLNKVTKSQYRYYLKGDRTVDVAKEEYLSDKFMEYVEEQQQDTSLAKEINDFFKKLWLTIKSFFTNNISNVEELYFRANKGFYKNAKIDYGSFSSEVNRTRIAEWPSEYTKEIVDSINHHILVDILPDLREANDDFADLSDTELLNVIAQEEGPFEIWGKVYDNLVDIYEDPETSDEIKNTIENVLPYLFTEDGKPGNLIYESIRALDFKDGIKVNIESVYEVKGEVGEQTSLEDNETSFQENWQTSYTERSRKNNAPAEVKRFIRYMATGKINALGLPSYVDYDQTYDTLLSNLADSTHINDMIQYLEDSKVFYPEYQQIIDKINADPQFASQFFNAFHNTHTKYLDVIKRFDRYIVTEANRNGVVNSIIESWKNGVLSQSKVVNRTAPGEYEVNSDKAKEIKQRFTNIISKTRIEPSDFNELTSITEDLGFRIDENIWKYAYENNILREILQGIRNPNKSLARVIDKFVEGKNPFDEEAGIESSEINSIRMLATVAKKATPSLYESSFRNINNKTQYAHLIPNFLSKLKANITNPAKVNNIIESYYKDGLYNANPILETLYNLTDNPRELSEAFDIAIVNGLIEGTNRKGYPDMTEADYEVMAINSYFNNGNKLYSYYKAPTLSDAPNMVMYKFSRFSEEEVVNYLVRLAEQEYLRIQDIKNHTGETYDNYHDPKNGSTETGYHIMPMFNGTDFNPGTEPQKSAKIIKDYLNSKAEEYLRKLEDNRVIVRDQNNNIDYENSRIDERIKNRGEFKDFIRSFYYNDYLMKTSFSLMTIGDPAFYSTQKGTINNKTVSYVKRAKEIYSPKYIPNTEAVYVDPETGEKIYVGASYNSIYLKDNEIPAPSLKELKTALNDAKKQGYISDSQLKSISASYTEVNQTDAQAYITLPFYRKTMISLGRKWTDRHQKAYKRLEVGKGTAGDIALVMQPIKPFVYTMKYDSNLGRIVPIQHKNSEFLLLPQLALATNADGSYKNPTLATLYNKMIDLNVDVANFSSAVKVGLTKESTVENFTEDNLIEIPMEDRGIQMEVPENFVDSDKLFGTQIRKLIMSDLVEGVDYKILPPGKTEPISMKAADLQRMYENIIEQDLLESFESTKSELTNENGSINWKKVHKLLLEEARNRGKGEQFEKAIQYDEVNDRIKLPLFHPLYSNDVENILTALFKNRVTKQKISGGAFVQVSSFGLSNELKLVYENGGLHHAEVLLPAWTKEFFKDFVDQDGNIDFEQVQAKASDLLDMIGYRIPTEDDYSMLPLRVVGFTPLESGGAIMLPAEITKISGSDFDVDKMYIMMRSFKRKSRPNYKAIVNELRDRGYHVSISNIEDLYDALRNKKELSDELQRYKDEIDTFSDDLMNKLSDVVYEVEKYDIEKPWSEQSKGARNNAKIDIMLSILRNPATLSKIMTPGGFDQIINITDYIQEKTGQGQQELDVFDPMSMDTIAYRNMVGSGLIGIAANHNVHHALRQNSNLELSYPVIFDNQRATSIHDKRVRTQFEIRNSKLTKVRPTRLITKNFAELIAAAVDNAKDPRLETLGYSANTADTFSIILATGFDIATASSFVNQPIIKYIQEEMVKNPNKSENQIIKETSEKLNVNLEENISDISTFDMFDALGSGDINTDLQKKVLIAYDKYKTMGKDLGKLIQASRADAKPLGPKLADGEVLINNIENILERASDGKFSIKNVREFLEFTEDTSNFVPMFTELGIKRPLNEVLQQIFPYTKPLFNTVKKEISSNLKYRDLTADERNQINKQLISYLISGYDFFDYKEMQNIVMSYPTQLFEEIKRFPELKNNDLLKRLNLEVADKRTPIDRIVVRNAGVFTSTQRENVQNAWLDLLESDNESIRNIGLNLIKYSYFTSGLGFRPKGFAHLIPADAYIDHVKDSNNRTLGDYLYEVQNEYSIEDVDNFKDQFYRNNYNKANFVPRVKDDFSNVTNRYTEGNRIIGFTVHPEIASDEFIKVERYWDSEDNKWKSAKTALPYISYRDTDGNINLYKFTGMQEGQYLYEITNKLGIPNYVVEYNSNMDVPTTMFDQNSIDAYNRNNLSQPTVETIQGQNINNFLSRSIQPSISQRIDQALDQIQLPAYRIDTKLTDKLASSNLERNEIRIRPNITVEEFWKYFKGEMGGITSQQKKMVLNNLRKKGLPLESLEKMLDTPKKIRIFLILHEQSHLEKKDALHYYKQGKDLTTQDKIDIETRATIDALSKMIKPTLSQEVINQLEQGNLSLSDVLNIICP